MPANTPLSELEERISRLQQAMARKEISAALIYQRADLFYFSGTAS